MRRSREPLSGSLTVRWAVNGTLANGSDLQPLAQPTDRELDRDQRQTLSAFALAAWRACEQRSSRYFAFFPLDDAGELWSLSRVSRLGQGARGWVLVIWSALLDRDVLDRWEWPSHRLLSTAFPEETAPDRGQRYGPVKVDLAPANLLGEAWWPNCDLLAASLDRRSPRAAIRLEAARGLPGLSPEAALFAMWSRLGCRRADLSFCTWAGLETASYPPHDRPFHVVIADAGASIQARPGRQECLLRGGPADRLPLATEVFMALDGVEFPTRSVLPEEEEVAAAEIGRRLYEQHADDFVSNPRAAFTSLSRGLAKLEQYDSVTQKAVFKLLDAAVSTAIAGPGRAKVIGDFAASADTSFLDPTEARRELAHVALRSGALPFLSAGQWVDLSGVLFPVPIAGDAETQGALSPVALDTIKQAPVDQVSWLAILDVAPHKPSTVPLIQIVAAKAPSESAWQKAFARLQGFGWQAMAPLIEDSTIPHVRRLSWLTRLCRSRADARGPNARGLISLVIYQRYCLWLRTRVKAALSTA